MDPFNNNSRLQDNLMYSLEWAKFLRHNISEPLIPFLFEWKEDKLFMNMLQPGGDPEDFAYKVAKDSKRESDQFVVGYEGFLQNEQGEKQQAFILKGYDKTQDKGVFLAQLFLGMETEGEFKLIDNPLIIGNPDLPFPKNEDLTPNYESADVSYTGLVLGNGVHLSMLTHDNPAIVSNGIKRLLRNKLSEEKAHELNGMFEFSIAPVNNIDFMKYAALSAVHYERNNETVKAWEKATGKKVLVNLGVGEDKILTEFDSKSESATPISPSPKPSSEQDNTETATSDTKQQQKELEEKYQKLSDEEIQGEFNRILKIPNARTNIQCLVEVAALMSIAKERGFSLEKHEEQASKSEAKTGCAPFLLLAIIVSVALGMIL